MDTTFDPAVIRDFVVALSIGALVGVEREKHKVAEGAGIGGLRTFILLALAGAVSAWMGRELQTIWLFVATVTAVAGALITGYVLTARLRPQALGLTTELAAISVCLLGGMAMIGYPVLAAGLGVIVAAVLAYKTPLHGLVGKLGPDDIFATLRLLIATVIIWPLLPNRTIDPWGALNPSTLWMLVILISSLSLVGYVAVRWLGPGRGVMMTGLAGGLVSSTALTLSFARFSRTSGAAGSGGLFATGILVAWAVMFARVLVMLAVVNTTLLSMLTIPFLIMGLAAGIVTLAGALAERKADMKKSAASEHLPLKNPFSLTQASKFAVFFAAVLLVVKLVEGRLPPQSLYLVAAVAGLTDVDAITLSMASYAEKGGDPATACIAITIAAVVNTLVKCGIAALLGAPAMRNRLILATLAVMVAGAVTMAFAF